MSGLLDFLQSASNAVAGNVAGPVDLIAAGLNRIGVPVGPAPVGGTEWMRRQGLWRDVKQSPASVAGETFGLLGPSLAVAKAPQIAKGLLQMGDNLAAPRMLHPEAGAVYGGEAAKVLDKKYGDLLDAYLSEGKDIYLSKVVVPKANRQQGIGSDFMRDLVSLADDQGKTVTLTPSSDFGGNKARLEAFYKRFGFVPNKGKHKDFAISEAMYRLPKGN